MKSVLTLFFCLFFGLNVCGQSSQTDTNSEVSVEEISLARGDGRGKAGEVTDKFTTIDRPIYCLIQLDSVKTATIKMILIAVKAENLKPETKSISVSYTTNGNENGVTFNASPDGIWAAGVYRVDIYINNKLAKSRAFEIEKSPTAAKKEKSLAPRKKIIKPRKN